jgi:hypothetical protein
VNPPALDASSVNDIERDYNYSSSPETLNPALAKREQAEALSKDTIAEDNIYKIKTKYNKNYSDRDNNVVVESSTTNTAKLTDDQAAEGVKPLVIVVLPESEDYSGLKARLNEKYSPRDLKFQTSAKLTEPRLYLMKPTALEKRNLDLEFNREFLKENYQVLKLNPKVDVLKVIDDKFTKVYSSSVRANNISEAKISAEKELKAKASKNPFKFLDKLFGKGEDSSTASAPPSNDVESLICGENCGHDHSGDSKEEPLSQPDEKTFAEQTVSFIDTNRHKSDVLKRNLTKLLNYYEGLAQEKNNVEGCLHDQVLDLKEQFILSRIDQSKPRVPNNIKVTSAYKKGDKYEISELPLNEYLIGKSFKFEKVLDKSAMHELHHTSNINPASSISSLNKIKGEIETSNADVSSLSDIDLVSKDEIKSVKDNLAGVLNDLTKCLEAKATLTDRNSILHNSRKITNLEAKYGKIESGSGDVFEQAINELKQEKLYEAALLRAEKSSSSKKAALEAFNQNIGSKLSLSQGAFAFSNHGFPRNVNINGEREEKKQGALKNQATIIDNKDRKLDQIPINPLNSSITSQVLNTEDDKVSTSQRSAEDSGNMTASASKDDGSEHEIVDKITDELDTAVLREFQPKADSLTVEENNEKREILVDETNTKDEPEVNNTKVETAQPEEEVIEDKPKDDLVA